MKSPRPSALRATSAATLLLLGTCAALPLNAWAAPFASGNVVAYRVGSEVNAKSVYLAEYRVDGSLVQRIPLTSTDAAQSLAASSTTSEGLLTRSPDGRCLAVPGYKAIAGSADPKKATASQANRAVKLVDASGAGLGDLLGLGTAAFNKDAIRSAISNDCASAWASGKGDTTPNGGIWFKGAGNAAALLPGNTQGLAIADGQLLVSVASGGKLSQVGNNLPTSGTQSITQLSDMPVNNFRGIAFARLGQGSGAADTLYAAANDADQIQKYIRSGGTWTPSGSVALAGAHGLAVYATGDGNALLLASDGAGTLYQWFDASGATGILQGAPNVIATLPVGEAFYGLALAPESILPASPPTAPTQVRLTTQSGNDATLQWTAPVSGPAVAFYVVEVSQDNFTTVTQSAVATTPHLMLTGLPSGAQKVRVRAVNSVGAAPVHCQRTSSWALRRRPRCRTTARSPARWATSTMHSPRRACASARPIPRTAWSR
ncbi:fibronectin type III domain-containing protein [Diaphorobacter aerolatus]|uniref:Fibronectin type III domain-containing protein n=1 Tax=Diaphorobacter aerolatus TaxID=1288495 RepID=A0A7H0GG99_9BURK|nr:fibronectin type III domain-containing protein [Diaphorobacter aerolatus]QNP47315.1 fibronectin type III domain-containing protein [Diaphorobacter aerolatus]